MPSAFGAPFRAASAVATVFVLAFVFFQSTRPRGEAGVIDLTANEAIVAHFAIYGVLAFFAMGVLQRATLRAALAVLGLAILLGASMEVVQLFVPSRNASVGDVLADTAGAMTGIGVYLALARMAGRRKAGAHQSVSRRR